MTDAHPQPPLLHARNIGQSWSGHRVLADIDIDLQPRERLVVLGPSGCGKTTLLHILAGLRRPETGNVSCNGHFPVPGRDTVTVFQTPRLLPWRRAERNVEIMMPRDIPSQIRKERRDHLLAAVGLSDAGARWPAQLSGGMKQRLALARALAVDAPVMLLDEPFANLDPLAREDMQALLVALMAAGHPRAAIFVTHSVDEALVLGDRIIVMRGNPGRIDRIVTPQFRNRSAERRDEPDFYAQLADLRRMLISAAT